MLSLYIVSTGVCFFFPLENIKRLPLCPGCPVRLQLFYRGEKTWKFLLQSLIAAIGMASPSHKCPRMYKRPPPLIIC